MAAELHILDQRRLIDTNGIADGSSIYFYYTGTTTLAPIYEDSGLVTPLANPVVVPAGAQVPNIYLDSEITYRRRIVYTDGTIDNTDPYLPPFQFDELNDGSQLSVDLFTDIATTAVPASTTMIKTTGYSTPGVGGARYTRFDATAEASKLTSDPLWHTTDLAGNGWKLAEPTANPHMFGAVGQALGGTLTPDVATNAGIAAYLATSTLGDLANDDTEACQAAAHYWFDTEGSTLDYSTGDWAISSTVDIVAPGESGYLQGRPSTRQFVGGHFYILPAFTAANSVGAAIRIHGIGLEMSGCLWVDGQYREYADRRIMGGIEFVSCNQSRFENIKVEGTKRFGWRVKPSHETDVVTFFADTPRETSVYYSNCIGMAVDHTWVRAIGIDYTSHIFDLPTYTAVYGGVDGNDVWDPTPASYSNSAYQRSRLTGVSSGMGIADLQVGDMITNRYEVAPSYFGTYTSVEADSAFYVTAGDMSTKFQVGDRISVFAGPNGGQIFTITGFADSGQRINVTPAPADTEISYPPTGSSIAENYVFYTEPTWHQVMSIRDDDTIEIFPWLPEQTGTTGTLWPCYGYGVDVTGPDTANMRMGTIAGHSTGTTYRCAALFAPTVGTLLAEFTVVGLQHGSSFSDGSLGAVVEHCHFEGIYADVLQITASATSSLAISGDSFSTVANEVDPFQKFFAPQVRFAVNERTSARRPLTNVSVRFQGRQFDWRAGRSFHDDTAQTHTMATGRHLSNLVGHDYKLMVGNTVSLEVDFAERFAGLYAQRCQAKVHWTTATGAAPTGSITFTLTPRMIGAGWTFSGNSTLSAPAGPVDFTVVFHPDTKKVAICKHVGAAM